ncbi:MAG: nucleotidyltransferase [Bacteroidota bacterium]
MALNKDYKEFIASLNDNKVQYLVVGGYAVAFHGHPRYTKDIDIWIEPTDENICLLLKAIDDFGFGSLGFKKEDFSKPDMIVQIGVPPNRIDLLNSIDGLDFKEAIANKKIITKDGVSINLIGLDDLRKSKKTSGRPQDLADLENLQ